MSNKVEKIKNDDVLGFRMIRTARNAVMKNRIIAEEFQMITGKPLEE